jgi:hypothetical protein
MDLDHESLLLDKSYWKALCPWLHVQEISPDDSDGSLGAIILDEKAINDLRQHLISQGFTTVKPQQLWGGSHRDWGTGKSGLKGLAKAVLTLVNEGHPPSCILVYDEVKFTYARALWCICIIFGLV